MLLEDRISIVLKNSDESLQVFFIPLKKFGFSFSVQGRLNIPVFAAYVSLCSEFFAWISFVKF